MKIKVDDNIPFRAVVVLRGAGHDVLTVAEEGLTIRPGTDIWSAARREGRFLITQTSTFQTCVGFDQVRIADCSSSAYASRERLPLLVESALICEQHLDVLRFLRDAAKGEGGGLQGRRAG